MKNCQKSSYLKQDRKNRITECESNDISKTEHVFLENNVSLPVHTNRKNFQHQDLLVPWKLKTDDKQESDGNLFLRFYHVFEETELENLCKSIENITISKSYYDQGNYCIVIKKIK